MKINLLNNNGYYGLNSVVFPVEVEGQYEKGVGFDIKGSELIRVGGSSGDFDEDFQYFWFEENAEVLP